MLPAPDPQGEAAARRPACRGEKLLQDLPAVPPWGPAVPAVHPTAMEGQPPQALRAPLGLEGFRGSLLVLQKEGPEEGPWVPPTQPHLLFLVLQTLLTPAGHASHHHSNLGGPHRPPAAAGGVGSPGRMVGVWAHRAEAPQRGYASSGNSSPYSPEALCPCLPSPVCPRSTPSPVALRATASSCPLLPDAPRAQGVCT